MPTQGKPSLTVVGLPAFVIVGAGQAGSHAAFALRELGFRGRIVLLGAEGSPPYMRPPLSKRFLAGELDEPRMWLRPPELYEARGIELKLGVSVEAIDIENARVELDNGLRLPYDKLLLATGSRPRRLEVPGCNGPGVHYLRTIADGVRLRPHLAAAGANVALVGGGYVGLEVAATARSLGCRVRVLESAERLLARVTTPAISEFFAQAHRERGVEIECATQVVGFEGTDRLESVACAHGRFKASVAVVGIGAIPNAEIALGSGIACDDGIVVDEHCRTSAAEVFAAGDCTRHPSAIAGARVRLESVQNAVDQAQAAAANMCGNAQAYRRVPTFWSQQYEFRLQSAGFSHGADAVEERGNRAAGTFALLYRRGGELIGVDAVNLAREYLAARKRLSEPGTHASDHVRSA